MARVVIIGGGFAGIEAALHLRRINKIVEILVINKHDTFTFIPALYETAAGELEDGKVSILASKLLNENGIMHYHDTVHRIDADKKIVVTKNMPHIPFDVVVVACGAQTNYYNIPGADKFTFNLKTKHDAQRIFEYLSEALRFADKHNFVVCGGGLTGVEFAASLREHVVSVCRVLHKDQANFSVTIVEASPSLVANLPEAAKQSAQKYLTSIGITILTNTRITKFSKNKITSSQGEITFDMAVWCGGLKTHDIIAQSNLVHSDQAGGRGLPGGGMVVNDYLQEINHPFIFGGGDCISPANPILPIVKTAQNAVDQGRYLATNINAYLAGKPLKIYTQMPNKFYCALGKHMAVHVDKNKVVADEKMKRKKDLLEQVYLADLASGKDTKNIYG